MSVFQKDAFKGNVEDGFNGARGEMRRENRQKLLKKPKHKSLKYDKVNRDGELEEGYKEK